MNVSLRIGLYNHITRGIDVRICDVGQHSRRLLCTNIAANQGIHSSEQQVLRCPTQGIKSQGHANRRSIRLHSALVTRLNMRTVFTQNHNVARVSANPAIRNMRLRLAQHQIGSNNATRSKSRPIAAGGCCGAIKLGFNYGRIASLHPHRPSADIGAQ